VEGVDTDAEVERVLAGRLRHVLVRANARRFERFRRNLLILVRDEVHAVREVIDRRALAPEVEDTDLHEAASAWLDNVPYDLEGADLRVGHTTVVPRLGVRLVLAVAVAASGTATHVKLSARAVSASSDAIHRHPSRKRPVLDEKTAFRQRF
jgi:hypothetical protein